MKTKKTLIHIIGGGISGLVCALELEKQGLAPIILEKEESLGGRLRTTRHNGWILDHGFQVLLTAYPAAKHYLDFEKLDLCKFLPGAAIFKENRFYQIGDPLRHFSFFASTISFPSANLKDKWLVIRLITILRFKSIQDIFRSKETRTIDYLEDFGFSSAMIEDFFMPFFGGIFLEGNLHTSSRMFEFVFKMFAQGSAAIPAQGIQEIPRQLEAQLVHSTIRLNTPVKKVYEDVIILEDGHQLKTDYTVIASGSQHLLESLNLDPVPWNRCYNLYFEVKQSIFHKPLLGLVPGRDRLINNLHFVDDLQPHQRGPILSVTLLNEQKLSRQEIIKKVTQEIELLMPGRQPALIRLFEIAQALPVMSELKYKPTAEDIRINDRILLTGDHLCNPSLNGAMESGKATAELLLESIL